MVKTFRNANIGDSVTYITQQKQTFSGKVRMKFPTHVVIMVRNGQPKCVDDNNFVSVRKGRNG